MAPPRAQPDLADDATFDPRGHSRYNSTATQATLVTDVGQPGANAAGRALKGANSNDDVHVVDNQRFRVTAGTPAGPTAATTTANTGSPTAAAPMNIPIFTAAAPAVADPTTATSAGLDEGPSGAHIEGAAAGVVDSNGYEDSSDDGFDYNNAFVIVVPPGHKMIRVSTPGPDDYLDEDGNAWRGPVPIDDVPPSSATQGVDEDEDWVLSGGAHDDTANANDDNAKDDNDDDDAPPVPRATKRKRDDDDDEPAPRAHKKARRGKAFDIDELCARLAVIAWIIDVCGTCARLTDGRRDLFAGANADDAEGDAGADVDGPHNSENGSEAGAADEHDEDADWVLQP